LPLNTPEHSPITGFQPQPEFDINDTYFQLEEHDTCVNAKIIEKHGFEVVDLVTETSKTVVCKAIQKNLDRTVILRILTQTAADNPVEVEHFLSIARKVARIKSDSLAAIFDIVSEKDIHYVAMEHVEGPTLEELITACGPLPVEQVLRIAASLIISLDQLWSTCHIVHRNLKSSTIRLDARGVAKITDFSLAIIAGNGVNATALDEGHIVGTPCFLSPEQAQGAHTLTTQSDMYALGAVLYHLATGAVPFEGQDVVSILAAHVKQQIPPPHLLNKSIPISFSWFVHRLMMKNPVNRYANWQDVLQDIRYQLAGDVPSCVRPDEEYLSTINAIFDEGPAQVQKKDAGLAPTPAHIRLNKKVRDSRIAAYQTKAIEEEHASEIRKENLFKERACWCGLAVWLIVLFWFRAVFQTDSSHAEPRSAPPPRADDAAEHMSEPDESIQVTRQESTPAAPIVAETPPATALKPNVPATPAPAQKPKVPVTAAVTSGPAAAPTQAGPVPPKKVAIVPSGIPAPLASGLAQAFAKGDLTAARQLMRTNTVRFQERTLLVTLLDQVPDPDTLVEDYLKTQIGKPLIFEHNGKQRTIIAREVKDGIIHIEANGRGAEFPIDRLTSDEKLRWIDKPEGLPANVAYCLTLIQSTRYAEVHARAAACPLLAPILIEAAELAQKAAATQAPE